LPDPHKLPRGSGKMVRNVRLASAQDLDKSEVRVLILPSPAFTNCSLATVSQVVPLSSVSLMLSVRLLPSTDAKKNVPLRERSTEVLRRRRPGQR
jgi:hypothetical protein